MRVTLDNVIRVIQYHEKFATLRTYPYRPGQRVMVRHPSGRLKGVVELVIANPKKEDLERFLEISGFENAEKWWKVATRLHGRRPGYLVVVRINNMLGRGELG